MRLIALLILAGFSSCITLQAPQVKGVSNVTTSGLLTGQPRIDFNVDLYNPNSFGLDLSDFQVNLKYRNLSLADIKTSRVQAISGLSDSSIPLSFSPSKEQINNIISSGLDLFNQGNEGKFSGTGSFRVQKFIFGRTFNFRF